MIVVWLILAVVFGAIGVASVIDSNWEDQGARAFGAVIGLGCCALFVYLVVG